MEYRELELVVKTQNDLEQRSTSSPSPPYKFFCKNLVGRPLEVKQKAHSVYKLSILTYKYF